MDGVECFVYYVDVWGVCGCGVVYGGLVVVFCFVVVFVVFCSLCFGFG